MGCERSIPVLRLIGHLDELDHIAVTMPIRARLGRGESSEDVRFCRLDIPRRRRRPHLNSVSIIHQSRVGRPTLYGGLFSFFPFFPFFPSFPFFRLFRFFGGNKLSYWYRIYCPRA